MNLIVDKEALKRAGAQAILDSLPGDFPGVQEAREAQARNEDPAPILRQAWEKFRQQREREMTQLVTLRYEIDGIKQTLEIYRQDPAYANLSRTQAALKEQVRQAEAAERSQSDLCEKLATLQLSSDQEISTLKTLVAEQNQVIAKQQKRLTAFTGNEPSPQQLA